MKKTIKKKTNVHSYFFCLFFVFFLFCFCITSILIFNKNTAYLVLSFRVSFTNILIFCVGICKNHLSLSSNSFCESSL
uniref:Uncharacterized protein n=1 Tax=Octopus bimaculoides TaxID=37653 RepID=A0A0L8HTK1_OCTBM